jgi:hypothetical protein
MKKLILLIVFASAAFGQTMPIPDDVDHAIAATVNFEGTVTLGVTDLVTTVAPSIMPFGWTMLAFFGVCALLQTLLQTTLRAAASHYYHPLASIVAYVAILFRIVIATTMMSFYLIPIPGLPFNFHQIFPYLAQALSNAITTDLLRQVLGHFADAVNFLPPVGMFQVLPALLTVVVLLLIALGQVGMTIITAGSYAIVGMLTLCGPLMIPFYVLPGHDKKFWTWFDNMLAYSMYIFVGSGFIYIFCHSYLDFFTNLHGYSVGQWLVSLPYLVLITVVFLYTMFKVPEITHIIFGGIGGVAQGFTNALQALAVRGVAAALL